VRERKKKTHYYTSEYDPKSKLRGLRLHYKTDLHIRYSIPQRKDSTPPQNTGRPYSGLTQPVLEKRARVKMRGEHCQIHRL